MNDLAQRRLHLVRHGEPIVNSRRPPADWALAPSAPAAVRRWAISHPLPQDAAWFTSPERRALETAQLLHSAPFTVVDDLREAGRSWIDTGFDAAVARAFACVDEPAREGWESGRQVMDRVRAAVDTILARTGGDVVLVGHGTAWTLLVSAWTKAPPDLAAWRALKMPGVWTLRMPEQR
ncbi:MAG: histidine phosphatase family protein [Nocardioidaceae bacterium]